MLLSGSTEMGHQSQRRHRRFRPKAFSPPQACLCANAQFSRLFKISRVLLLKSEEGKLGKHLALPRLLSCTCLPFLACYGPGLTAGRSEQAGWKAQVVFPSSPRDICKTLWLT